MTRGCDFPLLSAAQLGDPRAALRAIKNGARPWAKDPAGDSALEVAARFGHPEVCSVILRAMADHGADPLGPVERRSFFAALRIAAFKNKTAAFETLMSASQAKAEQDPGFAECRQEALACALESAAPRANYETAAALARAVGDINAPLPSSSKKRALHLCLMHAELNIDGARAFLEAGADPNAMDAQRQTPLHELFGSSARWILQEGSGSAFAEQTRAMLSLLQDHGARPSTPGPGGVSALSLARHRGPEWLAESLSAVESAVERSELAETLPPGSPGSRPLSI